MYAPASLSILVLIIMFQLHEVIMFKVEKNIAVPERRKRKGASYPFAQMEIGDSFACAQSDYGRVQAAMRTYSYHHVPVSFTLRKTDDGFRCWRVE